MHSKKWFLPLVVLIIFILPSASYLLRDNFLGFDSYYHLDFICNKENAVNYKAWLNPEFAQKIFEVLPCNELYIKGFLITLFFTSLTILYLLFKEESKEYASVSLLFMGLTTTLMYNSFKIENDAFAYPILFMSMYFFLRFLRNNKTELMDLAISVILIFISALFWGGGIYLLIAYSLVEPILLSLTIPILLFFADPITRTALPRFDVQENNTINGLKNIIFYLGFMLFGKAGLKPEIPYFPLTLLLTLFGIINPKFFLLALPLLVLTIVNVYKNTSEKKRKQMIVIAFAINLAWGLTILYGDLSPTDQTLLAVQEFGDYSNEIGLAKANDWSYGHLIFFYGGTTKQHSGPSSFNIFEVKDRTVLTREVLTHCKLYKEYESQTIFSAIPSLKIYRC